MDQIDLRVGDPAYADLTVRLESLCARLPGAGELNRAVGQLRGPLRVAVTGRFGTGRDTVAAALRRRFDVSPIGPGDDAEDADAWLHVLAGWPREDDVVALAALDPRRSLVLLGKSDSLGSWPAARVRAGECAGELGRPVIPLMAILAIADLGDEEIEMLAAMAAAGEQVPPMQATFIDAGGPGQRLGRMALLRRLDAYGIAVTIAVLGSGRCEAAELAELLMQRSGLDALADPLRGFAAAAPVVRLRRVAAELEIIAAQGVLRDGIEDLLSGSMLAAAAEEAFVWM
ncbi:hypothetical protein [Williamsia sp.]|uniref:hypothetical protein n=1 Tax=Williamsia sp. TaxID=1872085 RepID=UPI002F9280F8